MDKIGKVNIDELDLLKEELGKSDSELDKRALSMIKDLEHGITTMFLNHQDYVEWAVGQIKSAQASNVDLSWVENPDRSGGQFTPEEVNRRYCNGGW